MIKLIFFTFSISSKCNTSFPYDFVMWIQFACYFLWSRSNIKVTARSNQIWPALSYAKIKLILFSFSALELGGLPPVDPQKRSHSSPYLCDYHVHTKYIFPISQLSCFICYNIQIFRTAQICYRARSVLSLKMSGISSDVAGKRAASSLFCDKAYVDGKWTNAMSGATYEGNLEFVYCCKA